METKQITKVERSQKELALVRSIRNGTATRVAQVSRQAAVKLLTA